MDKELYIPLDRSIVKKAVVIAGSQTNLAKYLTKNNSIGKIVTLQLVWNLLNKNKFINRYLKDSIYTLIMEQKE